MDYAFSLAAFHGHLEVVKLLLEKGTPAREAISGAASGGDVDMVQLLLEHGAHPDDGISSAAERGHVEIVKLLLEKGASANHGIREAAGGGQNEIVRLLLEHGADADLGLSLAAARGRPDTANLLLEHGAEPERAMASAVSNGYVEIVELLHRAGARLPQDQLLPLAVKEGQTAMVAYLAKQGCDPTSGLGGAIERGDIEMVRLLIENGARPGGFELRAAAQHGYAEILKLILPLAQAEINTASWLGQTPLDLAVQHGHEECAALLRAAGGERKGQ